MRSGLLCGAASSGDHAVRALDGPGVAARVPVEAAYSWRQDNRIGSIAPGKIANFTVLEDDPHAVDPARLKDVPVGGTVFEGRIHPVARGA
jgi:hypothetical protein